MHGLGHISLRFCDNGQYFVPSKLLPNGIHNASLWPIHPWIFHACPGLHLLGQLFAHQELCLIWFLSLGIWYGLPRSHVALVGFSQP
jgi:hypothetical protein